MKQRKRDAAEITRLGHEILHRKIEPLLAPSDAGKFVAIAIDSEDFEVHEDDLTAVLRLRERHPDGDVSLGRVGEASTYRMRRFQGYGAFS
jgi:hypothetical protein